MNHCNQYSSTTAKGERSSLERSGWRNPRGLQLFILFLLISFTAASQTNKSQYPLNDPRNPDCPCHKYQQLATEEYQRQQKLLNTTIAENTANPTNNNNNENGTTRLNERQAQTNTYNSSVGSASSERKLKKKKPEVWIRKKICRSRLKHSRIKKLRPDYSVCYKW